MSSVKVTNQILRRCLTSCFQSLLAPRLTVMLDQRQSLHGTFCSPFKNIKQSGQATPGTTSHGKPNQMSSSRTGTLWTHSMDRESCGPWESLEIINLWMLSLRILPRARGPGRITTISWNTVVVCGPRPDLGELLIRNSVSSRPNSSHFAEIFSMTLMDPRRRLQKNVSSFWSH
jgi:hypothetical protein